jgi:hydroxymethylbilane synthase
MLPNSLRIGTRKSPLALWQAQNVKDQLNQLGQAAELVFIESDGDQNQTQPLYAMGIQGIFTKALDSALLNNTIDLAVHSLKDVPTLLPEKIVLASVLARESVDDVLVLHPNTNSLPSNGTIATSSLRRKAQWLHHYPNYEVESLRGNVNTRLQKIQDKGWTGALFATAGLKRLALLPQLKFQTLNWMLPAPGQGAIGICCHEKEEKLRLLLQQLECSNSRAAVTAERSFLRALEGGCSAPIGVRTELKKSSLEITGGLFSVDGKQAIQATVHGAMTDAKELGHQLANEILNSGGQPILAALKNN